MEIDVNNHVALTHNSEVKRVELQTHIRQVAVQIQEDAAKNKAFQDDLIAENKRLRDELLKANATLNDKEYKIQSKPIHLT